MHSTETRYLGAVHQITEGCEVLRNTSTFSDAQLIEAFAVFNFKSPCCDFSEIGKFKGRIREDVFLEFYGERKVQAGAGRSLRILDYIVKGVGVTPVANPNYRAANGAQLLTDAEREYEMCQRVAALSDVVYESKFVALIRLPISAALIWTKYKFEPAQSASLVRKQTKRIGNYLRGGNLQTLQFEKNKEWALRQECLDFEQDFNCIYGDASLLKNLKSYLVTFAKKHASHIARGIRLGALSAPNLDILGNIVDFGTVSHGYWWENYYTFSESHVFGIWDEHTQVINNLRQVSIQLMEYSETFAAGELIYNNLQNLADDFYEYFEVETVVGFADSYNLPMETAIALVEELKAEGLPKYVSVCIHNPLDVEAGRPFVNKERAGIHKAIAERFGILESFYPQPKEEYR